MTPNRLAVQELLCLLGGRSETCLFLNWLKHNFIHPFQAGADLKYLQTPTLRQAWWHETAPSAKVFPLLALILHLCDIGRQGDSEVTSSCQTCW